MSPVPTHQAALNAIDRADFDSASVDECVELLGHVRSMQKWLHDFEAHATRKLAGHHAAATSACAATVCVPAQSAKTTVPHPQRKVGS